MTGLRKSFIWALGGFVALVASTANAQVTPFTSRTVWQTSLLGTAPTTLDFEGIAPGGGFSSGHNTATGLTLSGVNFIGTRSASAGGGNYLFAVDFDAVTPTYQWGSGDSLVWEGRGHLTVNLPANIKGLGFDFGAQSDTDANTAGTGFTMTVTTAAGSTVFNGSSLQRPNKAFFGVVSNIPIQSIQIETTIDQRPPLPILDNFAFAVPEPSGLALLGLGAIGVLRRRR